MMRLVKFTFGLLVILCAGGCSKDGDKVQHDGTLSMTLNGTEINFTKQSPATTRDETGEHSLLVAAVNQPDQTHIFYLRIESTDSIGLGTYSVTTGNTAPRLLLQLTLDKWMGRSYLANPNFLNPFSVTITSRTKERIQGNFQGRVTNATDTIYITNGRFDYASIDITPG